MSDENQSVSTDTICPGASMNFTFYNLTPGQGYNISLDESLSFTGASAGTESLPGGVTLTRTQATFNAPTEGVVDGYVNASFSLGVVVSATYVSGSTDLSVPEVLIISLLQGGTTGQGGAFGFGALSELPPTCVMLNPAGIRCPVCALDSTKCPEAVALGKQFYMDEHSFVCCSECPDSCEAADQKAQP